MAVEPFFFFDLGNPISFGVPRRTPAARNYVAAF